MAVQLIDDGPWTISGMVLQLIPWRPNFQPAFERLSSAAIWVQIHHLPMELWTGEILEDLAGRIGRLVKIDELTLSASRARFARVCIELDLSKPLKSGMWIGPKDDQALAVLTYERLPTFCFSCGCVGHGSGSCKASLSSRLHQPPLFDSTASASRMMEEMGMQLDGAEDAVGNDLEPAPLQPPLDPQDESSVDESFGSWMVVSRRRGRGSGRRSSDFPSSSHQSRTVATWPAPSSNASQVEPNFSFSSARGRGGRVGLSRADFSSSRADQGARGPLHLKGLSIPSPPSPPEIEPSGKLSLGSVNFAAGSRDSLAPFASLPDMSLFKGKAVSSLDAPVLKTSVTEKPSQGSSSLSKDNPAIYPLPSQSPPALASSPVIMTSLPSMVSLDEKQVEKQVPFPKGHSSLVDRVTQAICPPPLVPDPLGQRAEVDGGEEESMVGSESSGDIEDDTTLLKFQKDFKVQGRREDRRARSGKLKGRSSAPY